MPPRRRPAPAAWSNKNSNNSTPKRTEMEELHHRLVDNHHDHDDDDDEDEDDDDIPPLIRQDDSHVELHHHHSHSSIMTRANSHTVIVESVDENDDDDEDDDDDEGHDGDGCLHCHAVKQEIQVRCDECSAYICDSCHWCHEFQANHEIRVCDRCDAFYCRQCDEMDQCDDCGEVVCASCSTLLSCKFCGGGLCEECATACGRCGIVLCSRDAKFAVDCDTCRLSYCLVCLASGSKDPCVRCGHRPSKRMEQLVHLRLKSIYKAFKQSNIASSPSSSSGAIKALSGRKDETDHSSAADGADSLMHAAASASAVNGNHSVKNPRKSVHGGLARDKADRFKAEKEKADAAAAALLAELEEEEEAAKSKKSKKKKKKEKLQAKKEGDRKEAPSHDPSERGTSSCSGAMRGEFGLGSTDSADVESNAEYFPTVIDDHDSESEESVDKAAHDVDPLEEALAKLVDDEDMNGIEKLIESIKGVPGRAALRKNAKKALKRLKMTEFRESSFSDHQEVKEDAVAQVEGRVTSPIAHVDVSAPESGPKGGLLAKNSPQAAGSDCRIRSAPASLRSEFSLPIPPALVGWVIGKGGQRIRDMMEESGARIWIDQESMGPNEPRMVNVSGQRKSVDIAARILTELVAKAPIPSTPQAKVAATSIECASVKSPSGGNAPIFPETSPANDLSAFGVQLQPRGGSPFEMSPLQGQGFDKSKEIVTCDPRFVPLLIGKRGWTIKNIQDSSGARVDIDQSVSPRRITISGSESQVKLAMTMVRDVLSYPQAQLQNRSESNKRVSRANGENLPADGDDCLLATAQGAEHDVLPFAQAKSQSHSPPSSLIMTGDAKSTVSASSSLSSTPEQSMASSKGTNPSFISAQSYNEFALPPPASKGESADKVFSNYSFPPVESTTEGVVVAPTSDEAKQFGSVRYPFLQNRIGSAGVSQEFNRPPLVAPFDCPVPSFSDSAAHSKSRYGPSNLDPGQTIANSLPLPLSRNGAFQANAVPFSVNQAISLSHVSDLGSSAGHPVVSAGLWNQPSAFQAPVLTPPQIESQDQHLGRFQLDAAVDFLEHSKQKGSAPLAGVDDHISLLALSGSASGLIARNHVELQISAPPGVQPARDESLIVDSLFGPLSNNPGNSGLLSGLNGLSISSDGLGSGLWGPSTIVGGLNRLSPIGSVSPDVKSSSLFSSLQTSLATGSENQSRSRFDWGPSNSE